MPRRPPLFVLDSREPFEPVAVEAVQEVAKIAGKRALVDSLPAPGGRMDFPPDPEKWAPALQGRYGGVGYAREVKFGSYDVAEHWLFYLHNPKSFAGYGAHEGDWERIAVYYAKDIPFAVWCSQHHQGERRFWWDVELRPNVPANMLRPVIYVARGSHAHYFERVRGSKNDDFADGQGRTLDLEWRPFGAWADWPGRWGNSTGIGESPLSPARQSQKWRA